MISTQNESGSNAKAFEVGEVIREEEGRRDELLGEVEELRLEKGLAHQYSSSFRQSASSET